MKRSKSKMGGEHATKMKNAWESFIINDRAPNYPVRKEIFESWKRCKAMGIDPYSSRENVIKNFTELLTSQLMGK